jgi:hypothetical protein
MASRQTFSASPSLAATARVHAHASETRLGVEMRKAIAVFCGIGLIVSVLLATSRLDRSAGFF